VYVCMYVCIIPGSWLNWLRYCMVFLNLPRHLSCY